MKKTLSLLVVALVLVTLVAGGTAWARGGGGRAGGGLRGSQPRTDGRTALDRRNKSMRYLRLVQDRTEAENRDAILRDGIADSV